MRPRARIFLTLVALSLTALALASCASSTDQADASSETTGSPTIPAPTQTTAESIAETTTETAPATATYNDDFGTSVAPILATHCASCHSNEGPGTTHWNLETAADAVKEATSIAASVSVGAMPPWPAGHESVAFKDDRSLAEDEIAAIVDWVHAGAKLDVDPATPIVGTALLGLSEIDTVVRPAEPYVGSLLNTDDYRCQIYDPELTETEALTGYNFVPDQTQVVHHAIGFLVRAEDKQAALDRDAAEPGAGWQCYGGSGLASDAMLIGWAPGQDATSFPDGAGYVLEPGDFFVLQIHYHYDTEAPADASELQLDLGVADDLTSQIVVRQYVGPVEIPCMTSQSGPLCDRSAAMEHAIARFGSDGVRSDGINFICGVSPDDFADMTDGRVASSCVLPPTASARSCRFLVTNMKLGRRSG
ncbi:MAG: hypothetical protein R2706_04285 [Acidimicrobiales bacterium]